MARIGKLARFFGALGGVGAVAWMMRDRFVSIAIPREPEPPAFRTPPTSPKAEAPRPRETPRSTEPSDDLTRVKGIGPVFAERLKSAGITTFHQIGETSVMDLASIAEISEARVSTWASQARTLATD